jgi:hypothetical protein
MRLCGMQSWISLNVLRTFHAAHSKGISFWTAKVGMAPSKSCCVAATNVRQSTSNLVHVAYLSW